MTKKEMYLKFAARLMVAHDSFDAEVTARQKAQAENDQHMVEACRNILRGVKAEIRTIEILAVDMGLSLDKLLKEVGEMRRGA